MSLTCSEHWRRGMSTESNLSRRKTWQASHQSRILQQASEVDARELVDHHCQGLESDYSTSTIPPEQKDSCQWAEVTSWMKIWEVTLDKGPRGTKSMWHCSLRSLSQPLAANHIHTVTQRNQLDSSPFHHLMETTHMSMQLATRARRSSENLSVASQQTQTETQILLRNLFYVGLYKFILSGYPCG